MAVSHSFAGEHVEDGGDEKADAYCEHHEIEHVITSAGVLQTLEISFRALLRTPSRAALMQLNRRPFTEPGQPIPARCPGAGAAVLQARIGFAPIRCPFHY
jgi:hypothetical protein